MNEKLVQLRDSQDTKLKEIEIWINKIINQSETESKIKKERCEICNSKEPPSFLELHHAAGRKHDFRTTTACKLCHRWLSDRQKMWDRRWEHQNQSENLRSAFFLQGLADILVLKAKKPCNSNYETLAYSLTEIISELLKRG